MELKEPVIMDITEPFRGGGSEDISKSDFFDFVVTPGDSNDAQSVQQFAKQMRSVNVFLEDSKETNNNSMVASEIPTTTSEGESSFDANFWSDKEAVRIETAILEDLNKYCWSAEEAGSVDQQLSPGKSTNTNTDGQIYTLTVLNAGIDQSATWYRPPKEDESISSPNSMEHLQAGLDIDTFLNIMPGQLNTYSNYSTESTDGLIKSETYTYEDSGFADNKDELTNALIIDTPMLEAHDSFNNNNNDWKMTNNNTSSTQQQNQQQQSSSPNSLLRSALQGKAAFVRYNGALKTQKSEPDTELRRALSTPPSKSEPMYIKQEPGQDTIPTIVAGIDANGKVIFEEHVAGRPVQQQQQQAEHNENNPSSTHNVDDLLLSQLDHSFPEDFEKLKRIANEVAESVNQYCHIDTTGSTSDSSSAVTSIGSLSTEQIGILYNLSSPIQITTAAPVVTSTATKTKKYKRQSSGGSKAGQTQVANASSTSNGVRKERSLHYCSICSKGFKDKYSVNVHIRTHTGEKPFACSLCGKSFRQKAHLAKHYQTHIAQKNAAASAASGGAAASGKAKAR